MKTIIAGGRTDLPTDSNTSTIEIMNMRDIKPSRPYDVKIDRSSPLGNIFYKET